MPPALQSPNAALDLDRDQLSAEALIPPRASGALLLAYKSLQNLTSACESHHAHLLHIQLDCSRLRVRYLGVNEIVERLLDDERSISSALTDLKHRILEVQRPHRTLLVSTNTDLFSIRYSQNSSGYNFELRRYRPDNTLLVLDQCQLSTAQLRQLRQWLSQTSGIVVATGMDRAALSDLSIAMTLELTGVDNTITRVARDIPLALHRVQQFQADARDEVNQALGLHNNVFVLDQLEYSEFDFKKVPLAHTLVVQTSVSRSADGALEQLLSMGYSPTKIALNSIGFLVRHSYRSLCEHCKRIDTLDDKTKAWINQFRTPVSENVLAWLDDGGLHNYLTSDGCDKCGHTGFGDVHAAYETVQLSDAHREALIQGESMSVIRQLESSDGSMARLLAMARSGNVSLAEVKNTLTANSILSQSN